MPSTYQEEACIEVDIKGVNVKENDRDKYRKSSFKRPERVLNFQDF